jgi:polysaccharide biosynthesis/export protein
MEMSLRFILVFLVAFLTGCATSPLPQTATAGGFGPVEMDSPISEYRIGPLDELTLSVFQEPDLSLKEVPVDASGTINLPLIGNVDAAGRTASELAEVIRSRLAERYIVDPQVSVIVSRSVALRVTVDGQVRKPGVYQIEGRTTLLESLARAEGMTEVASPKDVFVFRRKDGRQFAARFDMRQVYAGQTIDPELRGGDVVIVGVSRARSLYQDFLKVAPFLGTVFIALNQN